jgi:DNA-directed RNA polymerase specialized sigma24 family protein
VAHEPSWRAAASLDQINQGGSDAVPEESICPGATGAAGQDDISHSSRPAAELRLDLAAAIQSLPIHYRETIVLRDIEELTIDEIAARLDTTRETSRRGSIERAPWCGNILIVERLTSAARGR